jgi:hypothetical protein
MGLIFTYYAIAALTTSISTLVWYYIPVIRQARREGVVNSLTERYILGSIVFICVTFVLAPFVLSTMLFPSHGERFRHGLYKSIIKSDNE